MSREPPRESGPRVALLAPVVDVRRGELAPLFASSLWIFLALTTYYIIKPLRSAVLQQEIGVDNKPIALVATTVFVGLLAYGYGKIVPRVSRSRLIIATFCIFIVCIGVFAKVLPGGGSFTGYVFYVWVSTFNLMIVSQFWSLAADVWTKEEGTRLFGFIGVGTVAGGIFGTLVVTGFAERLSTSQMLLLSAALLGVCLLLALYVLSFGGREASTPEARPVGPSDGPERTSDQENSLLMVARSPYLRLIAAMMFLLNIVNTGNEWILDKMVSQANLSDSALTQYYGQFFLAQNVITFCIQLFLTSRVQKKFGARTALLFEPLIGIFGGIAFIFAPILPVIRWHKTLENACDYSIQSNTKELLYLPLPTVEKYSAKNVNDTLVVRAGDAVSAAAIFAVTSLVLPVLGHAGLKVLVAFNVGLGVVWVLVATKIGRAHAKRMQSESP